MIRLMIIVMVFSGVFSLVAQEEQKPITVQYITAELIYLDGGRDLGISAGDTLLIKSGETKIGFIQIVNIADNSSSGKVLVSRQTIKKGDQAFFTEMAAPGDNAIEPAADQEEVISTAEPLDDEKKEETRAERRRSRTRYSGSVSAQFFYLQDQGPGNLDFLQPTIRLNLRGRQLWGKDYNFRIKTRTRYNEREQAISPDIPAIEWQNRIYEASFSYENPQAALNFRAGRIISNFISSVGYIDGVQLQYNSSSRFQTGLFAGTQPDWRTSGFATTVRKMGVFANLRLADEPRKRIESTVAVSGEYNKSVVSREFIYLRNSFFLANSLNIYQTLELDINRKWRQEKAGESISVSNFYVSANWTVSKQVRIGASFDNRKNYWTYQYLSFAELLFDDALRRGVRGNTSIKLPNKLSLNLSAGYNKRESDPQATRSYSASLNKTGLIVKGLSANLRWSAFSSLLSEGYNTSLRLGKSFAGNTRMDISAGQYRYEFKLEGIRQDTPWTRLSLYAPLPANLFVSADYEYEFGNDIMNHRAYAQFGYRF